ncbi:oligosaccharide flippase family protein [bacterium]|nr:oligosaccharide flippase family protein [bacterium]
MDKTATPTSQFFRTLAGHTIVFGLSTLVRPLSQLVLVRLHTNTHFVSVEGFAAWSLLQVALNVGIVLFNLGLATAFFKFYLLAESDAEKDSVVSRTFFLTLIVALVGGGGLLLTAPWWSDWLIQQTGYALSAKHIATAIIGNTLTIIPLAYLRAEGRWKPFLAFNLLKFFALIGFNAWFLIGLNMGVEGITLALAVSNILFAFLFVPLLRKHLKPTAMFSGLKPILWFSIPLITADFTFWALNSLGQILLVRWQTPHEVALFGFALRISAIAQVAIVMPFSVAFAPLLFRAQKEQQDPRPLYARTMGYIWTIAVGFCLVITLFSNELVQILGKNPIYYDALPSIGWIVFGFAFYGVFFVFAGGPSLKGKTWVFPIILIACLAVEYLLMTSWIPARGEVGAAQATLAGYATLAVLTYIASQIFYPIQFPWKRVGLTILAAGISLSAWNWFPNGDYFLLRLTWIALFPLILIATGYLDEGEKRVLFKSQRKD